MVFYICVSIIIINKIFKIKIQIWNSLRAKFNFFFFSNFKLFTMSLMKFNLKTFHPSMLLDLIDINSIKLIKS